MIQNLALKNCLKLLRIDHQEVTCSIISENLDILDEHLREVTEDAPETEDGDSLPPRRTGLPRTLDAGKVYLGAGSKPVSIGDLQEQRRDDVAFFNFRTRFAYFLQRNIPKVDNRPWSPMPEHKVSASISKHRLILIPSRWEATTTIWYV